MIDIGSLYTRIEADTSGLNKAEGNIKAFASKAAGYFAGIASLAAITKGIKDVTMATARYDTMGVVMNNVGKNAGYSADQMAKYEKQVRATGISMTATRETLTKLASAEINLAQSTDLARIAQDAAVIANINSSDAFERMINGIKSGELEILKTMGLNVSFEDSYQKLAIQLGKTTKELTNQEKTQARVNSVLEEGKKIQGTYAASMTMAGKKWLSLKRYIDDTQVILGRLFQPAFGTIVDAITDKLKAFGSSLDEAKLKEYGDKINSALKGTLDFAAGINKLSDSLGTPGLGQLALIGAVLARFGPQAAAATAVTLTFANGMEIAARKNEESSIKSVSALVALQKQWEVFTGMRNKGGGGILNVGELYTEVERIQNKIEELKNFKEPWQIFPDPAENKRKADAVKAEIENLQKALVDANLKQVLKENYVDPWIKAGKDASDAQATSTQKSTRSLETLKSAFEKHRDAIKKISDDIKNNQLSGEQLVRNMERTGMTEIAAWKDMRKEAQEYEIAAKKALEAAKTTTDPEKKDALFADAIKYADLAQDKFVDLNKEVANGDQILIKQKTALDIAVQGAKRMIELKNQALVANKDMHADAANSIIKESDFTVASKLFETIKTQAGEISTTSYPAMGEAFNKVWQDGENAAKIAFTNIEQEAGKAAVAIADNLWIVPKDAVFDDMAKKVSGAYNYAFEEAKKASTDTKESQVKDVKGVSETIKLVKGVYTNVFDEAAKSSRAATEQIISDINRIKAAAAKVKLSVGGSVNQQLKEGGSVLKAAMGRYFPGYGGGDKIDIKGEAGEFMIRKEKVREAGLETTQAYNRGDWARVIKNLIPKLQTGGPVFAPFPRQALAMGGMVGDVSSSAPSESIRNYYIQGSPDPIRVRANDREADRLLSALQRKYKGRS